MTTYRGAGVWRVGWAWIGLSPSEGQGWEPVSAEVGGQVEAAGQEWGGVWGLLAGGGPMEELVGEVFGDVGCVALWTQLHNSLRLQHGLVAVLLGLGLNS